MTPQRYERLHELFSATCELESHQQSLVLDRACAGDPSLRRDAEALLARDRGPASFLDRPVLGEDLSVAVGVWVIAFGDRPRQGPPAGRALPR